MKKSLLLLLLLSLITVSCSGNKAEEDVADDTAGIEMEDASDAEFEEEDAADVNEEVAAASDEESQNLEEEEIAEEEVAESDDQQEVQINEAAGQVATYTVEKNETLMWIAFKIYGDYSKWKDIRAMNTDKIRGQTVIAGTQINYTVPDQEFKYNPKGNPYLIKQEDTLGTISTDVYGTGKHWKYIWDNNKVMIKNPNLIFAGFTLYYVPLRDVANN
jgi:nucleoid-associated protein YgaU